MLDLTRNIFWRKPNRATRSSKTDYDVRLVLSKGKDGRAPRMTVGFGEGANLSKSYRRVFVSTLDNEAEVLWFQFTADEEASGAYRLSRTKHDCKVQFCLDEAEEKAYNDGWSSDRFFKLYHEDGDLYYIRKPEAF